MTQIFIISGTSWTVPADWNAADNSVETIGAGGGGQTANASFAGSGGGGGAYSKITNLSLVAGATATVQIGGGGISGGAGGDTWFNGTSLATSSVGAQGGAAGADNSGGAGGASASGVGQIRFSGGSGAPVGGSSPWAGAGGGGAAGPNGVGGDGGSPNNQAAAGAGGGGGNGNGTAGGSGDNTTGNGGSGGSGNSGVGGGIGDTGSGAGNAATGSGGGGGGGRYGSSANGGDGATGNEFDTVHGSGGGGGGGGGRDFGGTGGAGNGGNGAKYGGGGGGGGYPRNNTALGAGGNGGQGLVIVTYTPATSATVTARSPNAMEFQAIGRVDHLDPVEFRGLVSSDGGGLPIEGRRQVSGHSSVPIEPCCAALLTAGLPTQWAGFLPVAAECFLPVEFIAVQLANSINCPEWNTTRLFRTAVTVEQLLKETADAELCPEFRNFIGTDQQLRFEVLATRPRDATVVLESLASGARIAIDEPLYMEWADPPTPVPVVASDRLRRSPGKVRVLAGPGSLQRLRGL